MLVIGHEEVRRLMDAGAQLVEVLPEEEYGHEHIAGAINIPLKQLEHRVPELDPGRPVIAYCHDFL